MAQRRSGAAQSAVVHGERRKIVSSVQGINRKPFKICQKLSLHKLKREYIARILGQVLIGWGRNRMGIGDGAERWIVCLMSNDRGGRRETPRTRQDQKTGQEQGDWRARGKFEKVAGNFESVRLDVG